MDNLHSSDVPNGEKDSNEKVIRKRRSSVFQSRASTFNECEGVSFGETAKAVDAVKNTSEVLQEENFNLKEYIMCLKNEREEWIDTLKQRKAQRKNLTKEKLHFESQGQLLDLSILTDCEKAFIRSKPNYQYICRNYKKLLDITVKLSVLHNKVYKLNQRFISQMEGKLHRITEKVIEISRS
ncbi:hypothetical protein WH47_12773 [Habropoda laboriosa]|uniref:Uncharacterized protein n=1 Tax=Habropoda laboriosa TaxID=597456 RepID=A0A0L7R576_9HYME|nr:PREDICTED: uncharacterized protein LOC108571720 [Habropoda laboriosa]KOC65974.1 hypothetical protein WH47_12773 [Habropoda laboriosa]